MKRLSSILAVATAAAALCLLAVLPVKAQQKKDIDDNSILLIVGRDTTTRGDFLKAYSQNLSSDAKNKKPTRNEIEAYRDLYINFRLKVMDALDNHYDTLQSLKEELDVYRQQLAKPYVMNVDMQNYLEQTAMERIRYDVFARHILVALPLYPSPEDTLKAYKKILEVRKRLLKGENFADVAFECSDDIKADRFGNKVKTGREGEMGYFTVLSMIYQVEEAVYSMRIGELSQPVRTRYGYHIVQLLDRKPALGKVTLSHILMPVNTKNPTPEAEERAKRRADSAYAMLRSGVPFEEVAREMSEDRQTAMKGGHMGTFAVNRMIPEVISQLYALEPGGYTKPFRSRYGWQIVRLEEKTGTPSEGDALNMIRYGIEKGMDRGSIPYTMFLDEKLKTSHWEWNQNAIDDLKAYYKSLPGLKSISKDPTTNPGLFTKTLLVFEGQPHDVWKFMHSSDKLTPNAKQVNNFDNWFKAMQEEYLRSAALQHELGLLEYKYPDFAKLMKEYRDGVYLFEINNRRVWAKALSDSTGLEEYFARNGGNYICPNLANAMIMSYDVTQVPTAEMAKFAQRAYDKKMNVQEIEAAADKKFGPGKVKVDSAAYKPGENVFIDHMVWEPGLSKDIRSGGSRKAFVIFKEVIPARPYDLQEIKGIAINDYQNWLEEEWIKELRAKYNIDLKRDVYESLFK